MKTQKHDGLEDMTNNPGNYKWGIFYFNPDDRRVIVPKRNVRMGWTINFANRYSYVVLMVIMALAIIIGRSFT